MKKISAVIIAKNEENLISDCIKSLFFCDEILLVDNKSLDKTADIAKKLGAKVITLATNDFSALRNEGLKKSSYEWVLYVDADERVSETLKKEIQSILNSNPPYSAYRLTRKN